MEGMTARQYRAKLLGLPVPAAAPPPPQHKHAKGEDCPGCANERQQKADAASKSQLDAASSSTSAPNATAHVDLASAVESAAKSSHGREVYQGGVDPNPALEDDESLSITERFAREAAIRLSDKQKAIELEVLAKQMQEDADMTVLRAREEASGFSREELILSAQGKGPGPSFSTSSFLLPEDWKEGDPVPDGPPFAGSRINPDGSPKELAPPPPPAPVGGGGGAASEQYASQSEVGELPALSSSEDDELSPPVSPVAANAATGSTGKEAEAQAISAALGVDSTVASTLVDAGCRNAHFLLPAPSADAGAPSTDGSAPSADAGAPNTRRQESSTDAELEKQALPLAPGGGAGGSVTEDMRRVMAASGTRGPGAGVLRQADGAAGYRPKMSHPETGEQVSPFNLPADDGRTMLGEVCSNETGFDPERAVKCVLDAGGSPLIVCAFAPDLAEPKQLMHGWHPLTIAALRGHCKVALLLLDGGADVNARTGEGETALHWAAGNGATEMVQLLLDRGAWVNVQDDNHGHTALHLAGNGQGEAHRECVRLLVGKGGADTTLQGHLGELANISALESV
jgi:hypothetical protein